MSCDTRRCTVARRGRSVAGRLRDDGGRRSAEALLSAEEVALYFGVTTATVYRWCKEGQIPCMKVGKLWRVRREELVDFLEKAEDKEEARHLDG